MPSTFTTDPIGPRSVDEMLDVVYGRADVLHRRRTMQRMAGGIAAVVLALTATLTLQGSNEGAHVRVVDEPKGEQEADAPTDPDGDALGPPAGGQGPTSPSANPDGVRASTPSTVPPTSVPSTSVPVVAGPPPAPIETWKTLGDPVGDGLRDGWYYDITNAAMEYDPNRDAVVFTTSYRSPTGSTSGRPERMLHSGFAFDGKDYVVSVREANDQLGEVVVDDVIACPSCTSRFDAAAGRLVVTVPLAVMNQAVERRSDGARLRAGARIDELITTTSEVGPGGTTFEADTSTSADD